uniref:Phosphofructokinase domain-containing protein n=1 Tax=Attheya septentrionalis TaxID=420275 RepID=A0A6T7J7N3_9STRA|mmetsp:Transcript_28678/g.52431  ORF Transcript_28678/g.52431 Transcript_28678/m.52431 type:complete len:576 (+) Transcript_28678:144-1871(+)
MDASNNSKGVALMATAVVVGTVAGMASYSLSKLVGDLVEAKRRVTEYEKEKKRMAEQKKQKPNDAPPGTKLPSVAIDEVYLWEVEHLSSRFESEGMGVVNHMHGVADTSSPLPSDAPTFLRFLTNNGGTDGSSNNNNNNPATTKTGSNDYNKLIGIHECILADITRTPASPNQVQRSTAYVRAGPRRELHFHPRNVNAAIVTCGGLCPGLNNVVREITNSLVHLYGVEGKIWGIRGGYKGFHDSRYPPILLTPQFVEDIHHDGGTVLSSSRGGFDLEKIIGFIKEKKIQHLYVIGGDGTHRGAFIIHEGCMEREMNVAVAGIPKTIDNDVDYIDRSFGFASAVEAAQSAIRCAKTEASCNLPNGIGIVKLMGRSAGFIAVHATLGSGDVDLCLVPEVPTVLDGKDGCLPHLMRRVKQQGYAVVVVAEGAGEELLGTSAEVDASGNKKLPKIGEFLKTQIEDYYTKHGDVATVKYIDPSYMIRSVPANAADSLYCMQLAQNAVHGAMAGFTGFSVGLCNNKMVFLPIPELVSTSPRMMNPRGRTWERVLALTRQPNTVPKRQPGEKSYDSHAPLLR